MAYIEVRKAGKLIKRRLVDDDRAQKGFRIRVGSAGQVHLRTGESKTVGKYEVAMHEGIPPEDRHEVTPQLVTKSDSFPAMSKTEQGGFTDPNQTRSMDRKSSVPVIDNYEVTGQLGQGGMGTVWRAVQLSTKREVALKFLGRHRFASKRSHARFEREVSLAAKLAHPNIACVYDSGLHRGVYYYAMELIDGIHLDKYVQQNELSPREILTLMKDVCDAIGYAHDKRIIHRDLKPSNILVTQDGRPHVVDFGLAKASMKEEDDVTISIEGEVTGTLGYMSPEQAAGRLDKIGEQTDVYSLGVILYQLLTGRSPHDVSGSRYDVVKRIVEEDVQSPREHVDSIDSDLESLILTALAKEPEDRYRSATILLQDMDNYLMGEPLLARSLSATYRIRKRVRKHAKPVAKILLLITIISAIVAISFYLVDSERRKRLEAERRAGLQKEGMPDVEDNRTDVSTSGSSREQDMEQGSMWTVKHATQPPAVKSMDSFVICARSCEPNDFAEVAQAGFNAVFSHNADDAYFKEAERHELRAIAYTGQDPDLKVLDSRAWSLQNARTLLAWFMPSDPVTHKIPETTLKDVYGILNANDKNHSAFLHFIPTESSWPRVQPYLKHCDAIAIELSVYDPNSRTTLGANLQDPILVVPYWMGKVKEVVPDKPLWIVIQAHSSNDGEGICPTPDQFRAMVYLAINHGASGIMISGFEKRLWQEDSPDFMGLVDPQLIALRKEALRVAGEIKLFSRAILGGAVFDEVTISNDNGKIDYKAYGNLHGIKLVVVNTSNTEVRPTIRAPRTRGTIDFLNEQGGVTRPPAGRFSDVLGPYKSRVYDIWMRENISIITDPEGNLTGNARKTYLDIVEASVYDEEERCVFTVTVADDFPDPRKLREEDTFFIRWFVDIIESREVDQGDSGNDYSIYLRCSNEQKWHIEWVKTSVVSKNDGIEVDTKKIMPRVVGNTTVVNFPQNYLPAHDFRWGVESSTRSSKGLSAARDQSKARRTFNWFPVRQ